MSEHEPKSVGTKIAWVVIALMLILIAGWTLWASRQPDIRSMWSPD